MSKRLISILVSFLILLNTIVFIPVFAGENEPKADITEYPEKLLVSGKAVYIQRNQEMIDNSKYCIVYYDEQNATTLRRSGTKIALEYAVRKKKEIYIFK